MEATQVPEDLATLKKKLNSLMCAIDEVSLKDVSIPNTISSQSTEIGLKYIESLHESLNDRLMDIKLNVRESVMKSLEKFENSVDEILNSVMGSDESSRKKIRKETDINAALLMEKEFKMRESKITDLINAREEFQTLKNMALALMTLFFINLMLQDYFDHGYFINIQTLTWCFSGFDMVITTWVLMFAYSYLVICLVQGIVLLKMGKKLWGTLYAVYQMSLVCFAGWVTRYFDLSFGSSMIIMCECFRIQMKIHSYFRMKLLYGCGENKYREFVPEFIKEKVGPVLPELVVPEVKIEDSAAEVQKFTYFLFAPTLLYRDQYILRTRSNWKFISSNFIEFLFGIYYTFIMFRIYLQPKFILIGKEDAWSQVTMMTILQIMLPSFLCLFILFYIVIHAWQNIWAEILRFPDRRFYEDWWNSMNLREWIRKFMTLTHEWLFTYVYIDLMRFSNGKITRNVSQALTFALSAGTYYATITFSIGFFGVEQFLIVAIACYLITPKGMMKKHAYNTLFWVQISMGISLLMTMYSRDYYRYYLK